jgi:hypothetical protein
VVGRDQADAAEPLDRGDDASQTGVHRLHRLDRGLDDA